jgi:hypothetical protein
MSTTNENILKSLAVLEQNLKEINSAKEQVNNVVKTSGNLAKVIESYQASFESLSINVEAILEDSRRFNLDSIAKLSEKTKNFSKEIAKLTEFDVSKTLKSIEHEVIEQFQQNLIKPLNALDQQTKNIKEEVDKLTEFNFQDSFSNIEKEVINQFNINLKKQLVILDNKGQELQSRINDFKVQIIRIEKIDLEFQFSELLKKLTNQADKQHNEFSRKYEEVKYQGDGIFLRLSKQDKEIKTLKTILFIIFGLILLTTVATILILK